MEEGRYWLIIQFLDYRLLNFVFDDGCLRVFEMAPHT